MRLIEKGHMSVSWEVLPNSFDIELFLQRLEMYVHLTGCFEEVVDSQNLHISKKKFNLSQSCKT